MVAEHTFRPPYFHRNTMTEFMGNIAGIYDAKEHGFEPGQGSLHSCMSGHGPESEVYKKAIQANLEPVRYPNGSMQFMFETCYMLKLAPWAVSPEGLNTEYLKCWEGFDKNFSG
mmetsp:Transcript_12906/g.1967  ORF Transcript_12906/g.1967 Transcript_12906/m.1967 type:complete len:114 (-) Transcript_12906:22-363(-)